MATGKPVIPGNHFKPSDFLVKTSVTGQTGPVNRSNRSVYRSEPVTHVLLNLDLNSTGFRSNRSGKPLPEGGGLTGPVGFVNPGGRWPTGAAGRMWPAATTCRGVGPRLRGDDGA